MYILEIAIFVVGALLLFIGYRKANRNLLVMAAVLLFLTGTVGDFASGFSEGISGNRIAAHGAP
jgi:hypothetical protein